MASTTASRSSQSPTDRALSNSNGARSRNGAIPPIAGLFDALNDWPKWQRTLARRRTRLALSSRIASRTPALSWGLSAAGSADEETLTLIRQLAALERTATASATAALPKSFASSLDAWIAAANGDLSQPEQALVSLSWVHALPWLVDRLPPEIWLACLDKLLAEAEAAAKSRHASLLARQLSTAELPRTLAYWFAELESCQRLAAPATAATIEALEAAVDAEGVIHGQHLPWLRPLLASWTRTAAMDAELSKSEQTLARQPRFQRSIGQALRLSRPDGTQSLSPLGADGENKLATEELFQAALQFAAERERKIAALAMPAAATSKSKSKSSRKRSPASKLPPAAFNSELSQLAVLRTGWAAWEERLTIDYHEARLAAELLCGREMVCSGSWTPEIEFNGKPLEPQSNWQEVCWVSDDDVDYLELEIFLAAGVRVQRHLLLARQDHFLFVADSVLGEKPGEIGYRTALSLAPGMRFAAAAETNEGQLIGRRPCGLVLPLALAEWRSESSAGVLQSHDGQLELRQTASDAHNLFAPLFIDLAPRRFSRLYTWRRLTVAENREIVPKDQAVGYRVQIGGQQWIFYRSLGPRGNRTLLGHNLVTEFLAARFNRDGVAEPLIEIE